MKYNKNKINLASVFDRIKIDLKKEEKDPNVELVKIDQSEDYIIYTYKMNERESYTYIIGQSIKEPDKIYYLGTKFTHVCVYKNNLFMCNHGGELCRNETFIQKINLKTKIDRSYDLRENRGRWIVINGYGRRYSIDDYKKMEVKNDELIISCHRTKSYDEDAVDDYYNKDMDFEIIFRYKNDDFVPYFKIEGKEFELIANDKLTDEEIAKAKREEKKERRRNKILHKLEDLSGPFAFLMVLSIVVGLIGGIITKFSITIWNIILALGIIGLISSDILLRFIYYLQDKKRK